VAPFLVPNHSGSVFGGVDGGDVRILGSLDYAFNPSILLGVRVGYVAASYPGSAAIHAGRAFPVPLHFELRATLLLGDRPLTHSGFAPLLYLAGGAAQFDAAEMVNVTTSNVVGSRPFLAWRTGGPGFAALGAGFRYALSPRVALSASVKGSLAFGGSLFPTFGPEVALQYGF
jgi:hypothetical protein